MEYHTQKAVVSQKAILFNPKKQILLLQRNAYDSSRPNGWDFPGGSLEIGEDPLQGITREIKEETTLTPKNLQQIFSKSIYLDDSCWSILLIYQGIVIRSKVTLSKEHIAYTWVSKKDVDAFLPKNYQIFLKQVSRK